MSAFESSRIQGSAPRTVCRHCGDECGSGAVVTTSGPFCCAGCESVFSILASNHLQSFYTLAAGAGVSQKSVSPLDRSRFAALDDPAVASRLVTFDDGRIARATLSLPTIHCASCVWLLEQLWRFDPGVRRAEVDLLRRAVHVDFAPGETTIRRIAEAVASLGYEPVITLEEGRTSLSPAMRRLYLQLGVAGFAFGNIMLFSIPRYANGGPLDGGFQRLFDALNVLFALPVLLFSAADYFRIAWRAVRTHVMALEIPVALGLAVLFVRGIVDIATARGEGFMDSFSGLVFFLLIGRLFQQKAFDRIAFDRSFRSFLPLSVETERDGRGVAVPIAQLRAGDRIRVRPHEVVPTDATLLDGTGDVDYAFITGESTPVTVRAGDVVRAGGRVLGRAVRLRTERAVSHSQLANLWSHQVFDRPKEPWLTTVAARFGGWFTVGAIGLAAVGAVAWWPDAARSASVATAVLIVACPCALTLAAPVTLGTAMGVLGTRGVYLKNPAIALDLSRIDTVVFDKTGTLTAAGDNRVEPQGLTSAALVRVAALASQSVHPTSRAIAAGLDRLLGDLPPQGGSQEMSQGPVASAFNRKDQPARITDLRDEPGSGLSAVVDGVPVAIGTPAFVAARTGRGAPAPAGATAVAAGAERGWIRVSHAARAGIDHAAEALAAVHELSLVSGDHDGERARWRRLFGARMQFGQSPADKLAFVRSAQARGRRVLMVGDGLNDAGALAAADVGMAVSDATACMTPACDVVISGGRLSQLPAFLAYARRARGVVIACLVVSLVYNALGLWLALTGQLTPLASAILMPVSSLTVVGLSSGTMRWFAGRMLAA
jgi:Cu+-exporting ATPase